MAIAVTSAGLAVILAIASVILAVIGTRMERGELPPNSAAGVRTERAFRSREDWYAVQEHAAPMVIALAVAWFDTAILFGIQFVYHDAIPFLVPFGVFLLQSVVGIVGIYRWAARAPRAADHPSGPRADSVS